MEISTKKQSIVGIKADKNSAFKRNIINNTRDVSRTDWRPFTLSIWAYIGSASLSDLTIDNYIMIIYTLNRKEVKNMFEEDRTEQYLKNLSVLEIKQRIFQLGCRKEYDTKIMEMLIKELERRQLERRKT